MKLQGTKSDGTVVTLRQHKGKTYLNVSVNLIHRIREFYGIPEGGRPFINIMLRKFDAVKGEAELVFAPSDRCTPSFVSAPHYRGWCGLELPDYVPQFGNQRIRKDDNLSLRDEMGYPVLYVDLNAAPKKGALRETLPLFEELSDDQRATLRGHAMATGFRTGDGTLSNTIRAYVQTVQA